jgi:hypothetical protein
MRSLQIQPVALVFKDLMSMKAAATVAQVTPELFGLDDAARAAAVQHLKFRTLDLGIVNAGLAEKALPPIAASANTSVPLLKAELIGQASAAIAKALGAGPTTDQLTAAVTAFVNDPKSLDLGLKSDEGLDLQTLAASASPADLLPHVTISAVANH